MRVPIDRLRADRRSERVGKQAMLRTVCRTSLLLASLAACPNFVAGASFISTGSLVMARVFHTATLLPSGKVLVVGGFNGFSSVSSAELYDPASGTFTSTGSLATVLDASTATLLPSGKVLVAGGGSADLYDPASGTFTATGSPASGGTAT